MAKIDVSCIKNHFNADTHQRQNLHMVTTQNPSERVIFSVTFVFHWPYDLVTLLANKCTAMSEYSKVTNYIVTPQF